MIHDWAGYMMMPIGLLLLLGEMTLLSKLMIAPMEHALVIDPTYAGQGTAEQVFHKRRR
jgi:hypothetical protein